MKKKLLFPKFGWRFMATLCVFSSIVVSLGWYFCGRPDKATFWMLVAIFNYMVYKL